MQCFVFTREFHIGKLIIVNYSHSCIFNEQVEQLEQCLQEKEAVLHQNDQRSAQEAEKLEKLQFEQEEKDDQIHNLEMKLQKRNQENEACIAEMSLKY